ncbi:MAG: hypothetical protein JO005_11650 [Gammaproteobacteria bacterium]|nr:hypothetical protein [Gammaproteobacteria bacterium]
MAPGGAPAGAASRSWQFAGLAFAAYVILQQCEALLWDAHLVPGAGSLGAEQAQLPPDPQFAPGFLAVTEVQPGSPLERAGVHAGDHVRFEPVWDYLRPRYSGETVQVTLDHAGQRRPLELRTVPRNRAGADADADLKSVLFDLSNLIPALFGAFVMWRSRGRTVPLLLGASLVVFGLGVFVPALWQAWPQTFLILCGLHLATIVSVNWFLVAFALRFAAAALGITRRWQRLTLTGYGLLNLLVWGIYFYCFTHVRTLRFVGDGSTPLQIVSDVGFLASLLLLCLGWRRAAAEEQRRYALLLLGFSAIVGSQIIAVFVLTGQPYNTTHPLLLLAEFLSGVLAPVTLTYAILRHRILDLGFAVNRSLIFAAVSAILLMAFGVAEWALGHLLQLEGRERSAWLEAGLALGVFLMFHRVRDFVKPRIEWLFYHTWQENERALREFVHQARYILKAPALAQAFVAELQRFSGAPGAALYLRAEAGDYRLLDGGLPGMPPSIDADEPALVALRSQRVLAEIHDTRSRLPASLALPMLDRGELFGVALLAAKPSGTGYRPDEKQVLAFAAEQVGLDLHALQIERLQERVRSLEAHNEALRAALSARPALPA